MLPRANVARGALFAHPCSVSIRFWSLFIILFHSVIRSCDQKIMLFFFLFNFQHVEKQFTTKLSAVMCGHFSAYCDATLCTPQRAYKQVLIFCFSHVRQPCNNCVWWWRLNKNIKHHRPEIVKLVSGNLSVKCRNNTIQAESCAFARNV